jgi:multicomponent Na+:H+ antiporter subunit F
MISAPVLLSVSIHVTLALLMAALVLTSIRVIIGPTLADRVLALDQLISIAIGFIAVIGIKTGFGLYIDIALALGLVGFLATTAFARYIAVARKRPAVPGTREGKTDDSTDGEQNR